MLEDKSFAWNAAYCIGLRLKVGGCKGSSDTLHGNMYQYKRTAIALSSKDKRG